jgi:CubicO group peptidase (beta-lactamase class C family)
MSNPAKKIVDNYTLLPSLAGGIIKKNGNMRIHTYGVKALDKPQMVDDSTTYIIGSCSKAMTATMIMKVCHEHGIHNPMRTITIGSVIPTVGNAFKNITLKQLLCMSSGLLDPKDLGTPEFWEFFVKSTDNLKTQRGQLTEMKCGKDAAPLAFKPGTLWKYCNVGYIVAAHIIEIKFNSTYEDMMQKYLFNRLNMKAELPSVIPVLNASDAIGHSIMSKGKEQYNMWLSWSKEIHKWIPSLPAAPKIIKNNTVAYVVDTQLQYLPPVGGPPGMIRLDMSSWLRFLYAIVIKDPTFLPNILWKILLNTGVVKNEWFPSGKNVKSNGKYSFGWEYFPRIYPDLLFYTGYTGTFIADVIIQKGKLALATMSNNGRGDGQTEPLNLLEYAMCPASNKHIKSLLKILINTPPSGHDLWIPKNKSTIETFTYTSTVDTLSSCIPLFLCLFLIILFKKNGKFI